MKERVAALTPTYYQMLLDTVADQNEKPNTRMSAWKGLQEFVKGTVSGDLIGSEEVTEEDKPTQGNYKPMSQEKKAELLASLKDL
jgi:hypothetical protein